MAGPLQPGTSAVPRVLAFIEALGVTGPARNLLDTAPCIDLHVATYRRAAASRAHHDGVDAFADAVKARGVPVHILVERHRFDPLLLRAVARTIGTVKPDLIQSHNIKSHALLACTHGRTPWVAFHHGYTDTDLKMRAYNRVDRWALRRASAVITPCSAFAADLASAGVDGSRVTIVHNAVRPPSPMDAAAARRALCLESEHVVVAIGRLSREKGHDVLIDACAALPQPLRVRTALVIAGDGPERPRLARLAAARGVRLRLDGYRDDVRPWYAAADVFVLPSRSEGSPNVLLEALAAGCPIVATRVGGVSEIAEDGVSASLVPADQPRALASAIESVLTTPALAARLAEGARRAAARFTPGSRMEALQAVYARVQA
jgi:glycosyltransferase involved in cell wall biosynthesis